MPRHANASTNAKDWSATQYLKFEKDRTRPARDLLAQVPLASPRRVVDLGCGPGNSTALLRERYPSAALTGMDSSPDMLKKARATLPDVTFEEGDMATYTPAPAGTVDLLYSNAAFQWLGSDARMSSYKRLLESLPSGGVLALQVPDNYTEPSHSNMRSIAQRGPWAGILEPLKPARERMESPQEIYDGLKSLCEEVNIWHSFYYHVLDDHAAVVEWVKGTGLRPFLDPLDEEMRTGFLKEYLSAIKDAYPSSGDGKVILRFPRLFVVATKA